MVSKGLGEHIEVGTEFTWREMVDTSDETYFDKEYTLSRASLSLIDLLIDDMTGTVHWEYWDTTDDNEVSIGGDIRQRLGRHHTLSAGTYYSKFKYREFAYTETLDVQTYFLNWRWILSKALSLNMKAEVEDADDVTYNSMILGLTYRF
jgi:hypothetical protein